MEVSRRRRIIQKHLEPARPLRRCAHGNFGEQCSQIVHIFWMNNYVTSHNCSEYTHCMFILCRALNQSCPMRKVTGGHSVSRGKTKVLCKKYSHISIVNMLQQKNVKIIIK